MTITSIILFIMGILVGLYVPLVIQLVIFVSIILFLGSDYVAQYEIGAIVFFIYATAFIVGILIGDISYAIQTDSFNNVDIFKYFKV